MAFDFFNEGLKKEVGVEFTKEENAFLEAKLPLLDSSRSGSIALGNALQFLKFSGLKSDIIQKILRNCKVQAGKKTLTYDDMKKIFRGVALAQNGIEPSSININANIKTKLPAFYDDDSDQEEPPKPPQQPQVVPPPVQPIQPTQQQPFAQIFPQPPSRQPPQVSVQQPPQQLTQTQRSQTPTHNPPKIPLPQPVKETKPTNEPDQSKMKEFDAYWAKLGTSSGKIEGGEVKNLCKNLAQRSNLSKAWKLCCLTHSGALTKGQFYVFLQLVSSTNKLPESLSPELKATIAHIDKPIHPTHAHSSPHTEKQKTPQSHSNLGVSQMFQNFGKSQLSITQPPPIKAPPLQKVADPSPRLAKALQTTQALQKEQSSQEDELVQLRRGQQAMNNMMGEVQQFLTGVGRRNAELKGQMEELKQGQRTLNERLNKVCMAMNAVIVRQNGMIEQLMQESAQQNALNLQRVTVLENYVGELERRQAQRQANREKERQARKSEETRELAIDEDRQKLYREEEERNQLELQRRQLEQQQLKQQLLQQKQLQQQQQQRLKQLQEEQEQERRAELRQQQEQRQQEVRQTRPRPEPEQPEQPQVHSPQQEQPEDTEYLNRMKMKQMQVIQLIHYLTPISPEQYPEIAQRITSYSQQNLNVAYAGLYQKLQAKQRLQQQQQQMQQQAQQREKFPDQDEFNTSNFHDEEKPAQGEDFFN